MEEETRTKEIQNETSTPLADALTGILKDTADFDENQVDVLLQKYGMED